MLDKVISRFRKDYQTLNKIEVSSYDLIHNFEYLSSISPKIKIAPVVKSNGYGHGIVNVAKILESKSPPFFCVDSLFEAYQLLKASIKTPILIMGYTDPQNFKVKKLPFSFTLLGLETAQVLNEYQPGCGVHIFVDTGMHREGIPVNQLPNFLQEIKKLPNIKIEGLMSHLASADEIKDPLNKIQIKNFKKALEICKKSGIYPKWIHLSNSSGLLNNIPGNLQNLSRIGLALYGLTNDKRISNDKNLKPILTFKSKVIQIKKLNKNDRIGYSGTFTARKAITLGVLPLGYYDGVDRRLSNKGWVTIDRKPCKILGRVSMNMTTIDLTDVPNPYIGQRAVIYSDNPKDKNSIENAAKLCQTIPYDLLVNLAESVKRIVL